MERLRPVTDDQQNSPRRAALVAALRRSAVLILVLAATGTALGVAAGLRRAEDHTAQASILVSPLDGNPFYPSGRGDDLINLETEAQLVGSTAVGRQVANRVGGGVTPGEVLGGLAVTVPANTQILTIDYTARAAAVARQRAQAFANTYLDFRTQRADAVTRSRSQRVQHQIDDQSKVLTGLVDELNAEQGPTRRALLQEQVNGVASQIAQLRAQLAELQTGSVDPGQVITPAGIVSRSPVSSLVISTIAGLIAGFVLAVAIVVVRTRAENRVHDVDDVTVAGVPLLGSVSLREVMDATHNLATPGHARAP